MVLSANLLSVSFRNIAAVLAAWMLVGVSQIHADSVSFTLSSASLDPRWLQFRGLPWRCGWSWPHASIAVR